MIKISENMKPTIGIEVHVELKTLSKMFCGCINKHFAIKPNTHTCPVCLGLPGSLPVPNKRAIDWTLMIGLALKSKVNLKSKFDRKHYFYPDLPKAFQISQYDEPLCTGGYLDTSKGKVGITRVHLEEDTGKLLHKRIKGKDVTLVDFNRSGVPLVEIVTDPDLNSSVETKKFAQKLRNIIRWLGVSDCDMEKGSMRLEANVSLGKHLGYKVEIKNLNSFRFVERAINYELERQKKLLAKGQKPKQETRGWDEVENKTKSQRYKETEADYRYFPEPDIPPMTFSKVYIKKLIKELPELPDQKAKRFEKEYSIRKHYAQLLTIDLNQSQLVEKALKLAQKEGIKKDRVAGLIVNKKIDLSKTKPEELIKQIKKEEVVKITDRKKLIKWVDKAIKDMPKVVFDYKKGKSAAIAVLIGKVMQLSNGKADPIIIKELLEKRLKSKDKSS